MPGDAGVPRWWLGLAASGVIGLLAVTGAGAAGRLMLDSGRVISGGRSSGGRYALAASAAPAAGSLGGGGFVLQPGHLAEPAAGPGTSTPAPPTSPTPPAGPSEGAPDLPDLVVSLAPSRGALTTPAGATAITTRGGQVLALPAGLELPANAVNLVVTITNAGRRETAHDFWVDLHVDPGRVPRVNLTWDANCGPVCLGAAWHVAQPLPAGGSLVLSTAGGYDPDNSVWPGSVPALARSVSVMVDSFTDQGDWFGMVLESDEADNLAQFDLAGAPPGAGGPTRVYLPAIQRSSP